MPDLLRHCADWFAAHPAVTVRALQPEVMDVRRATTAVIMALDHYHHASEGPLNGLVQDGGALVAPAPQAASGEGVSISPTATRGVPHPGEDHQHLRASKIRSSPGGQKLGIGENSRDRQRPVAAGQ